MEPVNDYTFFPCEHPRLVFNKYLQRSVMVSCGYCSACQSRKLSKYIPLILNESSSHKFTYFFTLTYNDEHLPFIDPITYRPQRHVSQFFELCRQSSDYIDFVGRRLPVISTPDVQKFIKRFRKLVKAFSSDSVRYFVCGDYGGTLFRPHYHGLFFFDDPAVAKGVNDLLVQAWSLGGQSLGFVEIVPAYGNGQYVAAYTRSASHRPVIYEHVEFAPKPLFSQSFGHYPFDFRTCKSIVSESRVSSVVYDIQTSRYRQIPLPSSLSSRLFPVIPTFGSLSHCERLAVYRLFSECVGLERPDRIDFLYNHLQVSSFFSDYIYIGFELTDFQVIDKFDRIYYTVLRLLRQSSLYGISVPDYDTCIDRYLFNLFNFKMSNQCYFCELLLSHGYTDEQVSTLIDSSTEDFLLHTPRNLHPDFFRKQDLKLRSLTKSKLNHAYLESHSDYKQFH